MELIGFYHPQNGAPLFIVLMHMNQPPNQPPNLAHCFLKIQSVR